MNFHRAWLLLAALIFSSAAAAQAINGTVYDWHPPYHGGYHYDEVFPSLDEAIDATWSDLLSGETVPPGCTYKVTKYTPTTENGGLAALLEWDRDVCGTGALSMLAVGASATVISDPKKNLGHPDDSCSCAGDPIALGVGNKFESVVDGQWGPWLKFERFYNSVPGSLAAAIGIGGWSHTYSRVIFYVPPTINSRASVIYAREDGKTVKYFLDGDTWNAGPDVHDVLTSVNDDSGLPVQWTMHRADTLETETYEALSGGAARLVLITDRNGDRTSLRYGDGDGPSTAHPDAGLLVQVTDPSGRSLNFHWGYSEDKWKSYLYEMDAPDTSIHFAYDAAFKLLTKVTYGDQHSISYLWNEPEHIPSEGAGGAALTGVLDELGHRYETTDYDASAHALATGHSGADVISVAYNSDGSAVVTEPTGDQVTYGFSIKNGVAKVASRSGFCQTCGGTLATASFDDASNRQQVTDYNGNVINTEFDSDGLLTTKTEGSGDNLRYTYVTWDHVFRTPLTRTLSDVWNKPKLKQGWFYNARGQVLAYCEIDPERVTNYTCSPEGDVPDGVRRWTYTYCNTADLSQCPRVGLLLSEDGPRTDVSDVTHYSYYLAIDESGCGTVGGACHRAGDLYQVTDALGRVTTYMAYDKSGHVVRTQDISGLITDLAYSPRGWLIQRVARANTTGNPSSSDAITTIDYDPTGTVHKVTDPDGVNLTYTYDDAHRLTDITDAKGNRIHYTLDAAGNKLKEETIGYLGTLRHSLARSFNSLGQLTSITDGLNHAVFNAAFVDSYDANGNLVHSADGLGVERKQGYDALNRLTTTIDDYNGTDPATQNTTATYAYDANDRLEGVMDPDNLSTTYDHDGLGNLTALHSPDTGTTTYGYDAAGNRTGETDAKGIHRTYSYDALNRITAAQFPDSAQDISYRYDESDSLTGCTGHHSIGHLTSVVENDLSTVYCYGTRGNVVKKRQVLSGQTDLTTYSYTKAGRLAGMHYPDQGQVSYTHSSTGHISNVTITTPDGTTSTISSVGYQPFGPLSSYTLGNGQKVQRTFDLNYAVTDVTSPALNLHFARDDMGDITALGDALGANQAKETYTYDPLYRLTAVKGASGTDLEAYTYNKTGDRLSKAGSGLATGTYTYAPGTHHLTATGTATRDYDDNGNTTGSLLGGESFGYTYNDRNRLGSVQRDGVTVGTYTYDAFGERIRKMLSADTVRYTYDEAAHLTSEVSNSGTTRDYVWLEGLPVAVIDTTSANGLTTSSVNYIHTDGLGAPRALTDDTGTVVWRWSYQTNPFGEQPPTSNGYTLNLRLPGQYYSNESELNYNVNRNYDVSSGRYIERDLIGVAGGLNVYGYAHQDPFSRIDQLGLADVYIWKDYDGWGHAALRLDDGTYISWWPEDVNHRYLIGDWLPEVFEADAIVNDNYDHDVGGEERRETTSIHLDNLDEEAIRQWWDNFKASHKYNSLTQNCSTTVAEALAAGGADRHLINYPKPLIWDPGDVLRYAEFLKSAEGQQIHFGPRSH